MPIESDRARGACRCAACARRATRAAFTLAAIVAGLSLLAALREAPFARGGDGDGTTPTVSMERAASAFLAAADPQTRARATLPFDSHVRRQWFYYGGPRPGAMLGDLEPPQRAAADALLRSALSEEGWRKVSGVMSLETVYAEVERKRSGWEPVGRDPGRYYLMTFGEPTPGEPWGFRLEGSHLSLHLTRVGDRGTACTPLFLGAQPAEVREGERAGERVLGAEEDIAYELLHALDEAQRRVAVVSTERVPPDVQYGPFAEDEPAEATGLAFSAMSEPQKALLQKLVARYAGTMREDIARAQLERVAAAGWDTVRFAWAGALEPGTPHYYRVQGPTIVIELDNTIEGANHIHSLWRDPTNDFGADLLRRHLEREHGKGAAPR